MDHLYKEDISKEYSNAKKQLESSYGFMREDGEKVPKRYRVSKKERNEISLMIQIVKVYEKYILQRKAQSDHITRELAVDIDNEFKGFALAYVENDTENMIKVGIAPEDIRIGSPQDILISASYVEFVELKQQLNDL